MAKKYKYSKAFTYEGKRYYVKGDSLKDVAVKMALKQRDLELGNITVDSNMTYKDWSEQCLNTYKVNQSARTHKTCLWINNAYIVSEIGNQKVSKIRPINCQNVLNNLEGKSAYTINYTRQIMRFVFDKAVDNNMILKNPAKNVVNPSGSKKKRRSLTDKERTFLVQEAVKDRRFYIYLLMLQCGCRPSEARECRGYDIRQIDGYNMLHIRGTKSENADRIVPIPDDLFELIKNTPPFETIAVTSEGNKISENYAISKVWKSLKRHINLAMGCRTYRNKLVEPLPFDPDITPYFLRHTYCTDLQKKGIDLKTAQYLMGHSDVRLTADIYTHMDTSQVISAAEIISPKNQNCGTHVEPIEKNG